MKEILARLEDFVMVTERRYIELGPESEGIDDRTKKIIEKWEKDGWKKTATATTGKNRRHIVFERQADETEQERTDKNTTRAKTGAPRRRQ